jgi:hypothetical protein
MRAWQARPSRRTYEHKGKVNGLVFCLEANDRQHRAEHHFLCDSHPVVDVGENHRLDKPAVTAFQLYGSLTALDRLSRAR